MSTALQTTETLDPIVASLDYLIVIMFPRSTSKNFPFALRIAQRMSRFKEGNFEGKTFYLAGVSRDKSNTLLAKKLLDYATGWKGTRVFISGSEYRSAYTVMRVLDCYSQAMQCKDPRAHCHVVIDHPVIASMKQDAAPRALSFKSVDIALRNYKKLDSAPKILFPCRYISAYRDVIQPEHPSPIQDQIQAAAVRHGCHWCPLFDPNAVAVIESGGKSLEVNHAT